MVATNLSGPRRVAWGAMRDHVMGVRAVTGRGEVIHSGGRVLKNVTGLDLCKLLTGSHGTLGVITEITLKVLPAPEPAGTLVLPGLDAGARRGGAVGGAGLALRRVGRGLAAGGGGRARARAGRRGWSRRAGADRGFRRVGRLPHSGCVRDLGSAARDRSTSRRRRAVWRAVRDAAPLRGRAGDAVWRVSVRPSAGPAVLRSGRRVGGRGFLDWGGGLVLDRGPATRGARGGRSGGARAAAPGC